MKLLPKLAWLAILIAASPIAAADFNLSPDCSAAKASVDSLWPPKHAMAPINVMGVTDPDGDAVDITIACITQDEPLNQIGDGNTEPDASGIGTSTALVLQERAGTGNGRFYHIDYIATDAHGARCGGGVNVRVDKSGSHTAIDDGRLYLSAPTDYDCRQHDINNSPVIYTEPRLSGETGSPYSYHVQAHDPDQDTLSYGLTVAPAGMKIDPDTGLIEWEIAPSQFGGQWVEVIVDDGRGGRDTQQFVIDVARINQPPVAEGQSLQTDENLALDLILDGSDPNADRLTYRIVTPPANGSLSGEGEARIYLPNTYFEGGDSFTFTVSDGEFESEPATVTISVRGHGNNPPRILSEPLTPHVLEPGSGEAEILNLSSWNVVFPPYAGGDPQPNWVFNSNYTSVTQRTNAKPSVLMGDFDFKNSLIQGRWSVNTSRDDDFIGFVFGYQNSHQFYLFDWKRNNQDLALRGMALRRIDYEPGSGSLTLWSPSGSRSGETLYRNSIPWRSFTTYDFALAFEPGKISITIKQGNRVLESFTVHDNRFIDGRFGFYNYSQSHVQYTGFASERLANRTYWYPVEAVDPDGDELTFELIQAPEGMSIDTETGIVRWETAEDQAGQYPVVIEVSDEHGATARQEYQLVVSEEVPVIVSTPAGKVDINESFVYSINAFDPNGDTLTYSLVSGPAGMTVDPQSGDLNWIPKSEDVGEHEVTVAVYDPKGHSDRQTFSLTVVEPAFNSAPEFISIPVTEAVVGRAYQYPVAAVDTEGDQLVYGFPDPVPYNMQMFDGRTVTWTPTADQVADHEITIDVSDGHGNVTRQTFVISVKDLAGNRAPAIESDPAGSGVVGELYEYAVQATDPDGDLLSYHLEQAPEGMTLDVATGLVQWVPEKSGKHPVRIMVKDGNGAYAFQEFSLSTHDVDANRAPAIISIPSTTVRIDREYRYQIEASDPDGNPLTYALKTGPLTMRLDPVSGALSWSPVEGDEGLHEIQVVIDDGQGASATQTWSIAVNPRSNVAPTITSTPLGSVVSGSVYRYQVDAYDGDGDSLEYALAIAPQGMTIDAGTGTVQWTTSGLPLDVYEVVIEVMDGLGGTASQQFAITVTDQPNQPPRITSIPSLAAVPGETYQYQMNANDPDGDALRYGFLAGPAEATLSAEGLLTWTPIASETGRHEMVVRVADTRGGYAEQRWSITVSENGNYPPIIVSTPSGNAKSGDAYSYQIAANDPDGDLLVYSLLQAPEGVTLSGDGLLSWTPAETQIDRHPVAVRATDTWGAYTDQSWSVNVVPAEGNNAPLIVSTPTMQVTVLNPYSYAVQASDADGDTLIYELVTAPLNMVINETSGLISWTPETTGSFRITVRVNDGHAWTEQEFTLTVNEPAPLGVDISVSPPIVDLGDSVTITVSASGGLPPLVATLFVDGEQVPLNGGYQAVITTEAIGRYEVYAEVASGDEITFAYSDYRVRDPNDTLPPTVGFDTSLDGSIVTAPVEIIGSANDDNFAEYRLRFASARTGMFTDFAEGTVAVTNGVLGTFDPSMLYNGLYDIQLVATDLNGHEEVATVGVEVSGNLKVGNFSFTVQDLNVPMVGIPIQVSRTYDSRRRFEDLDFGYGWSIDYQNVKVEESRTPGTFWAINQYNSGPFNTIADFCIEPMGAPVIAVTLPNDEVERFELAVSPRCSTFQVIKDVTLDFQPVGDTLSTLTALDDASARYESGTLLNTRDFINPVDPSRYKLTTQAGYEYILNQAFGVEKIIDPNGHTLTYTDDGIFHSSGKAVTFERNSQGRITDVIAPNGKRLTYHYDDREDLEHVIDRDNSTTHYTYNTAHGLVDIIDPLNRPVLKNLYDDDGRLYAQEDGNGRIKTFDHDLDAKTSLVTDRDGRSTLLEYDAKGLVKFETLLISDGTYDQDIVTGYSYDANGNQETRTIGQSTWTVDFDARNNQLFAQDPEGHTVYYRAYNARGQEEKIEDEMGRISEMQYDSAGNLFLIKLPPVIDPDTGEITTPSAGNIINANGQVTDTTDLSGLTTTYTYYPDGHAWEGQKWTESNPVSGTVTFTYDGNNNVKTETRERTVAGTVVEETTTYEYDARDRVTKTFFPDGSYSETLYDLAGNTDKERDRSGHWTDYTHDAYGRLTRTDYPDNTAEIRTYTDEGLLKTVTDRSGTVTRNEYDGAGRLWKVHNEQDGTYTETRYTLQGWVQYEWDEKRNRTEHRYDKAGRRTHTVRLDDEGRELIWSFEYYPNGELHKETDPLGHTTEYIINELDQRIETRYHNGTVQEERYDLMGRRIATIDQNQRRTAFDFDKLGRLEGVTPKVSIEGQAVPVTSYTYDEVGNKLTQTDANNHTTTWTYDSFGRVTSRTLPEGMSETFDYLDDQNTVIHTDFNGDTITTVNDAMGRVETVHYSKDGTQESYTYWPNDQIKTATTEAGVTQYFYDQRHRLDYELRPDGTHMDYDYDPVGNRTLVQVTRNNQVTSQTSYGYDSLNRLKTVTNDLTPGEVTQYTYDDAGNLDTVTYPNGLVTDYDYNSVNQLTDLYTRDGTGTLISHYAYTLDNTGRRTVISELDGRTTAYCHDALYRLTAETVFDSATSPITEGCLTATDRAGASYTADYDYDWVGNRTYETVDRVQTQYTYDANDRLEQTGGTVYGYDDNGNTITETLDGETTTYHYNGKNQLASVDKAGITTSYTYNPNGIRDSKTESGITTKFVVDENRDYAQVLEEVIGGDAQVSYSYGHDLISQERSSGTSFYHYDGLGSTRALSDASGSLTDTWNYEAFGEVLNRTGETENNYLFAGEQFDQSLNQYYLRARYYDQTIGRFTQQDTWMGNNYDPITLHKYAYGNADPVTYTDPTGHFSLGSIGAAMNTSLRLGLRAFNSYSNITLLMDIAKGDVTATELALTFAAARFLPRAFFKCKNSFTAGTLVHAEEGLVRIESISIGDKVWAYNEETGEKSLQEVIHLVQGTGTKELLDIELSAGKIITTTVDHPFFIFGENVWLEAGELTERHQLHSFFDSGLRINRIVSYTDPAIVYNLSIADDHTYYVGEMGALAHNCYQKPGWKVYGGGKHIAPKGVSRKQVRKSTETGFAKYYLDSAKDVKKFELDAWKKGIPTSKNPSYKVVEHPDVIGANRGRDVRWQRLEYDATSDTIHGHPITHEQYLKYLRD